MADIFLSYARADREVAETVAAALRAGGRTIWWDEGLHPRESWDRTIEAEIGAAGAVLVLWSPRAVESDWVRAEAHYGLDHRKLVPAIIEPCTLPIAFTMRQAVDLSGWHGSTRDQRWLKLAAWLDEAKAASGDPGETPHLPVGQLPRPAARRRWPWISAAFVLLIAAAIGSWLAMSHRPGRTSIRVDRLHYAEADPAARSFAQGLAGDLARMVVGSGASLNVADVDGPAAASAADFTLNGSVAQTGKDLRADLTLNSARDGAIAWSGQFTRPAKEVDALRRQAVVRVADVLTCAFRSRGAGSGSVDIETLRLYLQFCDTVRSGDPSEMIRRLVARAPDMSAAKSALAMLDALTAPDLPPAEAASARAEARRAATHALELDPHNGEAYIARALLSPGLAGWIASTADLRMALRVEPENDGSAADYLSGNLASIGRTGEAIALQRQSVARDPFSPNKAAGLAGRLASSGNVAEAIPAIDRAAQLWPESDDVRRTRATIYARYGDPAVALRLLETQHAQGPDVEFLRHIAEARADSGKMPALLAFARIASADKSALTGAIVTLAQACKMDEAYALTGRATDQLRGSPSFLFRPAMAGFRRDPRFMPLAKRIGLVDIWTKTGLWPDFCTAHDAPYDCRAIARRLETAG